MKPFAKFVTAAWLHRLCLRCIGAKLLVVWRLQP
jgi:hypothetical protein